MAEMHLLLGWKTIMIHKMHLITSDMKPFMLPTRILPFHDRSVYFVIADNATLNDPHDRMYLNFLLMQIVCICQYTALANS